QQGRERQQQQRVARVVLDGAPGALPAGELRRDRREQRRRRVRAEVGRVFHALPFLSAAAISSRMSDAGSPGRGSTAARVRGRSLTGVLTGASTSTTSDPGGGGAHATTAFGAGSPETRLAAAPSPALRRLSSSAGIASAGTG